MLDSLIESICIWVAQGTARLDRGEIIADASSDLVIDRVLLNSKRAPECTYEKRKIRKISESNQTQREPKKVIITQYFERRDVSIPNMNFWANPKWLNHNIYLLMQGIIVTPRFPRTGTPHDAYDPEGPQANPFSDICTRVPVHCII